MKTTFVLGFDTIDNGKRYEWVEKNYCHSTFNKFILENFINNKFSDYVLKKTVI